MLKVQGRGTEVSVCWSDLPSVSPLSSWTHSPRCPASRTSSIASLLPSVPPSAPPSLSASKCPPVSSPAVVPLRGLLWLQLRGCCSSGSGGCCLSHHRRSQVPHCRPQRSDCCNQPSGGPVLRGGGSVLWRLLLKWTLTRRAELEAWKGQSHLPLAWLSAETISEDFKFCPRVSSDLESRNLCSLLKTHLPIPDPISSSCLGNPRE